MSKNKTKKMVAAVSKKKDSITFKNMHLKPLLKWLDIPLHSQKAIARNRICEIIQDRFDLFEKDRIAILEKYAEKEKGQLKIEKDKDGRLNYVLSNREKFNSEFSVINEENVIFDILPSNREYWKIVRDIFESSKVEMNIETTQFYEFVLKTLENI
jgi:hypothetical protein